jgi:membrane protease YdiL (CAAX protease family)
VRHLRVTASLLGYATLLIAIYRIPELWVKDDDNFINSIVTYSVVLAVFLTIIFVKGLDCLEYFRLPRIGLASFSAIAIAVIFVSPRLWGGHNEMKPIDIALPGVIYLLGIGFSEEVFSRGLVFGKLRHLGERKAMVYSSVVFGLLHLNVYVGYDWDLWIAYSHVISAGAFGFLACAIMITTRSIWISAVFHTFFNWPIVFERLIEDSDLGEMPAYTLWDNLTTPWFELILYVPIALFILRINRGGWPKWVQKLSRLSRMATMKIRSLNGRAKTSPYIA